MTVGHGFEEEDRARLAQLYWAAFGGKLRQVLGPDHLALNFIARVADPSHALCIHRNGRLIAVAGYHSRSGALVGGSLGDLARTYGWAGAVWRGLALSLLERPVASDELLVDGIFVDPAERGRGHGTALIEALSREALERGCARVRLDVVDGNDRARALYERRGFAPVAAQRSRLVGWLFGISGATTMVRRVA